MSRVVSYAIFDNDISVYAKIKGRSILQFSQFLPLIIRAHHVLWSGWEMRLHHDVASMDEPYFNALRKMHDAGLVTLVNCGVAKYLSGSMLWRMKPAFETNVEAVVCRDLDIIPGPLDRQAVEEWMYSGLAVHVIHFAGAHSGIMGGTTSVRPARFRELIGYDSLDSFVENAIKHGLSFNNHGDDQIFLNWNSPKLCGEMLIHELHHNVGDLPAKDIRFKVTPPTSWTLADIDLAQAAALSPGIGICDEPAPALAFYDAIDLPVVKRIQECEE